MSARKSCDVDDRELEEAHHSAKLGCGVPRSTNDDDILQLVRAFPAAD
jgi:hypothetical protein